MTDRQKQIIIFVSLMFFLLVGISVYSQEPFPPATQGQMQPMKFNSESSTKNDIESKNNNYTSQNAMPRINNNDTPSKDTSIQNGYKENNKDQTDAVKYDPITGYTFWLMIFTGLLVVCNILLWIYTKKTANAAKKSADTLPLVERAYCFITSISQLKIIKENIYEISVTISNVGKTPAILKQIKSACILSDRYPMKHGGIEGGLPPGGAVIASNATNNWIEVKVKANITKKDSEKIQAKEIKLLCCGLIVYSDIWKAEHETGFCWEYTPLEYDPCFTLVNESLLNYHT